MDEDAQFVHTEQGGVTHHRQQNDSDHGRKSTIRFRPVEHEVDVGVALTVEGEQTK